MLAAALAITQREALTELYIATGGPNWISHQNWATDAPICSWKGVGCNRDNLVIQLLLPHNGLTGQLPDVFSAFPYLKILDISSNNLSSTFPTSLCQLRNLQYFYISGAGIFGELPQCICNMSFVQYFQAENNALTGAIPSCVGQMQFLRSMKLNCNLLDGAVPLQFTELPYLTELRIQCNTNIDCASPLSEKEDFIYMCGINGFHCETCEIPVGQCQAYVHVNGCGLYELRSEVE